MGFILEADFSLVLGGHVKKDCRATSWFGKKEYKLFSSLVPPMGTEVGIIDYHVFINPDGIGDNVK